MLPPAVNELTDDFNKLNPGITVNAQYGDGGLLSFSSEWGTQPRLLMAAASFAVAPVLVLFFVLQRYFVQGIARAGMKF